MNFSDKLNEYMKKLNCTSSLLVKESKLSKATISRYCNGTRTPINPSEQLNDLIKGLTNIAKKKNINISEKNIRKDFESILKIYDIDLMVNNFNILVNELKINISDFSKVIGFDASHLSRIRSGIRKPSNPGMFLEAIATYIIKNYNDHDNKLIVCSLLNCSIEELSNNNDYYNKLSFWLCEDFKELNTKNDINDFLEKLNNFDLNEYIKVIKFNELKVPTIAFKLPKSKNYYGIEEMKIGELDFLKSTVLSKSKESVFMCSDMQMDDMAKDLSFGKKWMFGIAMMLKKGLHLNVIHNIDRPFSEMMVGLESWIPIYMTGQVSPYYLNNVQNNIYSHLNYVSGSTSLTGECIKGYHNKGKYYLTNNKTELEYFKNKAKLLLKKAKPLMKIYRENDKDLLNKFLICNSKINSDRKIISSSLPIFTIKKDLLIKILKRNDVSENEINNILEFIDLKKERINSILKNNAIENTINKLNEKEFNNSTHSLELSEMFFNKKINYTYKEYLEHYNDTKEFEKNNFNYSIIINKNAFSNIIISININNCVMITKNDNPTIHFIIEHPKLCKAIENFVVPIIEK